MATSIAPRAAESCPPDLIRFVAAEATRDAERVVVFLDALDLVPAGGRLDLPERVFLDLGAALRLVAWEHAGITLHTDAGLPPARAALHAIIAGAAAWPRTEYRPIPGLARAASRLAAEAFAWTGRRDLNADILLEDPDDDAFVEALAHFLWTHRATATPDRGTAP